MLKKVYIPDGNLLRLGATNIKEADERARCLHGMLTSALKSYKASRQERETTWMESWARWMGAPLSSDWVRARASQVVGDVQSDWRHKIQNSKGFDIVETIVSYMMSATFPNKNWFDLVPTHPIGEEYRLVIEMTRYYISKKLREGNFKSMWEIFLRQCLICGTSVFYCPWEYSRKQTWKNHVVVNEDGTSIVQKKRHSKVLANRPNFSVPDIWDILLDPDADRPNEANLIWQKTMTKGRALSLIEDGTYDMANGECIKGEEPVRKYDGKGERQTINQWSGLSSVSDWHRSDLINVYEFWGDITVDGTEYQDIYCCFTGNTLLSFKENPYWGGRPFIVGTYTDIPFSPYGMGVLEPVLGNLHELDSISNQRLDGLEISINPMFEVISDGLLDPSEIVSEPGKVYPVAALGNIRPIPRDTNMSVSVQEEQIVGEKIDKATGTGAFISAGAGRNGERVTAQEIIAQRDAGGNRLTGSYSHIEDTSLVPILALLYSHFQQFVVKDEQTSMPGDKAGEFIYYKIGPEHFSIDYDVVPLGATYIADKETELRNMLDWISAVSASESMSSKVDWTQVLKDLTKKFLKEDSNKYLAIQDDGQGQTSPELALAQPTTSANPMEALLDPSQAASIQGAIKGGMGADFSNMLQANTAADGGVALADAFTGGAGTEALQATIPQGGQSAL